VTREIQGDADRFREAMELLQRGARERVYQAAVLLLAREEEILCHGSAGEANLSSIFDIASMTKPLVASLMLSPDGKVSEILPARSSDPAYPDITFRNLLSHTSGLPAYRPLFRDLREAEGKGGRKLWGTAEGHDRIVNDVVQRPRLPPPGTGDRGGVVHDARPHAS
jgi:CubicO group peptidase (beta-lactamase class C family)